MHMAKSQVDCMELSIESHWTCNILHQGNDLHDMIHAYTFQILYLLQCCPHQPIQPGSITITLTCDHFWSIADSTLQTGRPHSFLAQLATLIFELYVQNGQGCSWGYIQQPSTMAGEILARGNVNLKQ
jgi:hypothetical protein